MTVDDREKQIEDEDDGEEDCSGVKGLAYGQSVEVGYLMKSKKNRKEQI